jgi:hypothetical protein
MSDWRELGAKGDWDKVDGWRILSIGGAELRELRAHLKSIVPKILRGDGVETYWDYATSWEIPSARTSRAADLLAIVNRSSLRELPPVGLFCEDEIELAHSTLEAEGIFFEGMHETFIYWNGDSWVTVRSDIGKALRDRRDALEESAALRFQDDVDKFSEVVKKWRSLYPWRNVTSLYRAWKAGDFVPNSAADHALRLLSEYRNFRDLFEEILNSSGRNPYGKSSIGNKGYRAVSLLAFARFAMNIGTEAEALRKKPYEPLALGRLKQKHAFAHRNEGRDLANVARQAEATEWQNKAKVIAAETTLSGSARARWVKVQLSKRHGINRNEKTIAKALSGV